MTSLKIACLTIASFAVTGAAAAQPPVRTTEIARTDSARTVTLSLVEYNRLMDLASRPLPAPAVAPVGAVLASADLRVRIDRETAHGIFSLAGDADHRLDPLAFAGLAPVGEVGGDVANGEDAELHNHSSTGTDGP